MRWVNLSVFLTLALVWPSRSSLDSAAAAPASFALRTVSDSSEHAVVLELFTSEGCSSCPPADALLKQLDDSGHLDGSEIIAIEEHVDYWNRLGWTDPFSSYEWTARQERYAEAFRRDGIYTPQLVINGHSELVGSDERQVRRAIADAARTPSVVLSIDHVNLSQGRAELSIRLPQTGVLPKSAQLWLAVTERGLVSDVQRGENHGRRLSHAAVLRRLSRIGAKSLTDGASITTRTPVDVSWKPENLRFVVFLQDSATLAILGAATASAPH